jgi:hypothetical protein
MARTALSAPLELPPQIASVSADAQDVAFAASDSANGNETPCTGAELILVHNTDASAQTVTFTTRTDAFGRSGSIAAYSLAADEVAVFGPFPTEAWRQTDDQLYIDTSDNLVQLAALRLT